MAHTSSWVSSCGFLTLVAFCRALWQRQLLIFAKLGRFVELCKHFVDYFNNTRDFFLFFVKCDKRLTLWWSFFVKKQQVSDWIVFSSWDRRPKGVKMLEIIIYTITSNRVRKRPHSLTTKSESRASRKGIHWKRIAILRNAY